MDGWMDGTLRMYASPAAAAGTCTSIYVTIVFSLFLFFVVLCTTTDAFLRAMGKKVCVWRVDAGWTDVHIRKYSMYVCKPAVGFLFFLLFFFFL